MACPDYPLTKTPAQKGYAEGTRIIHHILWEHHAFFHALLLLGLVSTSAFLLISVACDGYECAIRTEDFSRAGGNELLRASPQF
jgi:hypothetical protein